MPLHSWVGFPVSHVSELEGSNGGFRSLFAVFFSLKKLEEYMAQFLYILVYMGASENGGTPKSSILIGFSILNHPFWCTPIFGNTHIDP